MHCMNLGILQNFLGSCVSLLMDHGAWVFIFITIFRFKTYNSLLCFILKSPGNDTFKFQLGYFGGGSADDCFRTMSSRFRLWARVNQYQYLGWNSTTQRFLFAWCIRSYHPLGTNRMCEPLLGVLCFPNKYWGTPRASCILVFWTRRMDTPLYVSRHITGEFSWSSLTEPCTAFPRQHKTERYAMHACLQGRCVRGLI